MYGNISEIGIRGKIRENWETRIQRNYEENQELGTTVNLKKRSEYVKNRVYRENKEYREINKQWGKGNIGKLGKLCCENEDKGLKKVVRCMLLNAHV